MADIRDKGPLIEVTGSGVVALLAPVAIVGGVGVAASNLTAAHKHAVRGINTVAAVGGETLRVQVFGPLVTGGTSWSEGRIYVGNGVLTQTRPTSGFVQIIAYADTATKIFVAPHTSDDDSLVTANLVGVQWGSPGAESGNAIEIAASITDLDGNALSSSLVDVEVLVSDGATDQEPSHTATLSAAGTPVGTILSGSGTARLGIRSASGAFTVKVTETAAANRYLWIRQSGNARLWPRSLTGVQELVFS